MASTPEGKVKEKVKRAFKELKQQLGIEVYYHMPVQNGMGAPTLDFVGCIRGQFFGIEAKAPGKKPTERQLMTIADMEAAGGKIYVYDGSHDEKFAEWLLSLSK
jgi:hypothetical protein